MKDLSGLATGIGSFPHKTAAAALEVIFRHIPEVPHWPQLPAAGEEEGFVRQYLSPLSTSGLLHIAAGRSPYFLTDAPDWLERQTDFYAKVLAAETGASLSDFAFPRSVANGFYSFTELLGERTTAARYLKGQLSGPVTLGLQLTDVSMRPAFYSDDLRELLVTSLSMQLRWQAGMLAAAGLPVIVFIDEPGILCFGQSSFVGLSREAIQDSLRSLAEAAHQAGALVGVHACAGVDWSLLFELPFDIVNVDVYHYFPSLLVYTDSFRLYLERGGFLAWGLVPTSAEVERETPRSLLLRLEENLKTLGKKGINPALLARQLIFTPSCGTGTLSAAQAERVYAMLQEISRHYQGSFAG